MLIEWALESAGDEGERREGGVEESRGYYFWLLRECGCVDVVVDVERNGVVLLERAESGREC